ncbi:hypothetical protein Phum_PHUM086040 [Pediculus humanus corporis]|uniref:Uncharacterized protein n=1 Tax=Pediculus humanus subsp. corporis TaxID=121224 RepID=E0VCD6_PEDHC|nr:uncharacterized protein Phum_PHUM086040 [Pediculus humanus corporis]EEB11042.1 hypothetical protein Phum_PHUM086040 [Pediculus humanus corporis]
MTVKVNGQEVTSIDLNSYKLPNVGVGVGGGGYEPEVRNYQQVNSFGGEVPSLPQDNTNEKIVSPDSERSKEEKTLRDFVPDLGVEDKLINIFHPRPIVDTATKTELNSVSPGNKADVLGEFVVRSSESVSRAINAVLTVPRQAFKQLSTGATEKLNQIGAYIVGL